MADTLSEVIAKCAAGDEQAVATLVERFQPWALDFAAAILDDRSMAADVVQESFVAALEKLTDLREADAFPGWFRQIIRTHASRVNRRRTDRLLPEDYEVQSAGLTPRDEAHKRQLEKEVRRAVTSLPQPSRQTTELFYFAEMPHAEIAARMRVPVGTVKRRLHDARKTLRSVLTGRLQREEPRYSSTREPNPFQTRLKENHHVTISEAASVFGKARTRRSRETGD